MSDRIFDPYAQAYALGAECALRHLQAADPGDLLDPSMSGPLSGEWAGEPTPQTLAASLGIDVDDLDATNECADRFEEGYWATIHDAVSDDDYR